MIDNSAQELQYPKSFLRGEQIELCPTHTFHNPVQFIPLTAFTQDQDDASGIRTQDLNKDSITLRR